jgi:hypothetical protein
MNTVSKTLRPIDVVRLRPAWLDSIWERSVTMGASQNGWQGLWRRAAGGRAESNPL